MKFTKIDGYFEQGHIYGSPKIYKSLTEPPLRPINLQIPTVAYQILKELNELISPYIPSRFSVKST